ncbi:MAG: hypothetical protein Q8M17_16190 [Actinomycetota bacterium]|nr:hypothetical protein [Actinomycetota bacterium]
MAGRGPAPKQTRIRERDTKRRAAEFTVLHPDGVVHGPDLPEVMEWPEQTVEFWQALRTDAAASTWTEVEWRQLVDVALLHADLWSGNAKVAAEIRLRLAAFGLTPSDRLRVRQVVAPPGSTAPNKLEELQARQASKRMDPARMRRIMREVNKGNQV